MQSSRASMLAGGAADRDNGRAGWYAHRAGCAAGVLSREHDAAARQLTFSVLYECA
jgi:hypothetical protein